MKRFILRLLHHLARSRRYHLSPFSEQLTVETHLSELLSRLGIDLVIDVGANVGQYGNMLRSIGYSGEIISLEPCDAAFKSLQQDARKDGKWNVHQLALGDTESEVALHLSESSVFNSIHPSNAFGNSAFRGSIESAATETVRMTRLDDFLERHVESFMCRKTLLKMDTQGHDHAVFAGAGKYKDKFAALQSELSVCPIYKGIPGYGEMLAMYQDVGYGVTGLFAVNRIRETGHVIEFDCVLAPQVPLAMLGVA